jgi:formamidopyrimidine-DNA glycosylase
VPELPEMQALAERLDALLAGARVVSAEPLSFTSLKTVVPGPHDLVGHAVVHVGRRGKYALIELDDGVRLAFHLSQGGRVDVEDPPKRTRPKGAVARWVFDRPDDGPVAVLVKEFGTERKAGWWLVPPGDPGPTEGLGPEPDDPAFLELIRAGDDTRRIHTLLRDQRTVAGIGRGNSDDVLHAARLSPFASLKSLDVEERERLLDAIRTTLDAQLANERKRTGGLPTKLGDRWVVHHRHGEPCPRCGEELQRVSYSSHEVTYCPACQTGGKILADRRMSRLLR